MSAAPGLVLADTSAWIAFLARRGHERIKDLVTRLLDDDRLATAGPIVLELLQGCRSTGERDTLEERLGALHWLPTESHHWHIAGRTAFSLRRLGLTVGAMDALIATLAEFYGLPLLHRDRGFEMIARHRPLRLVETD